MGAMSSSTSKAFCGGQFGAAPVAAEVMGDDCQSCIQPLQRMMLLDGARQWTKSGLVEREWPTVCLEQVAG